MVPQSTTFKNVHLLFCLKMVECNYVLFDFYLLFTGILLARLTISDYTEANKYCENR